jgi:serine/threonine-protein kinase
MNATHRRAHLDEDLESKYEIFEALGGGGMGRVLRARHRQLKRLVAIKLLHQDLKASEAVSRFLREARAAAQIRSVHVAHVMDAGILRSGQPYIVMEYLQGQDLAKLIGSRGRLPVEQAVGFTLQALDALAEAHSLQIIHRDIKPGNLFATRIAGGDITIKVVDFGLAKTTRAFDTLDPAMTERGAVLGTPSYMSPEQFVDAQDVDARADIWGVGATLFELLTGIPPFTGTNLPQIYTAVMHQPIPSIRRTVPELPEGLDQVVATCLTREREKRYLNVADLAVALAPFAPTGAHDRIDRIRRVVEGVRESADMIDLPVLDDDAADFGEPAERFAAAPGVISSTFERRSSDAAVAPLPAAPRPRARRKYAIAIAVLLTTLGVALWQVGSKPAIVAEKPSAAETNRGTIHAASQGQTADTMFDPAPYAAPAVAEPHSSVPVASAEAAAPPTSPQPTVSRTTAKKAKRTKVSSAPPKVSGAAIYEQYP